MTASSRPPATSRARDAGRPGSGYTPSELIAILGRAYGRVPPQPSGDPMAELVLTLLSQHTSDHNSGRAFHRLIERFPAWDAVIAAPTAAVEDAIRPGGLAPTKAPRLQELLAAVRERAPAYDLAFLARLPLAEAKAWLRALPGVGPKTAACVLLFALGRPALPVDTHVDRVARRLGLVPPATTAERAHELLEAQLRPQQVYAFHVDLIQHGRRTCHARPACPRCPLLERCPRVGLAPLAPPQDAATAAAASSRGPASART
ncbi:MAG: endonuclease III [Dehalococcoidia bacterium]|nr:endonuclease III [Dehalococcoidia bacterium]